MDPTAELAAVVRRVSADAYERLLLLFHHLISSSSSSSSSTPPLSLPAVCAIVLSACPGSSAARFLFALGSNDRLLRSPDAGRTWRVSFARSSEDALPAQFTQTPTPNTGDAADVLIEMQRLLSATSTVAQVDDDDDEKDDGGANVSKFNNAPTAVLLDADGYEEVVALCGRRGFLAVSGDRGVTFTTATHCIPVATTSLPPITTTTKMDTAAPGVVPSLEHVCVLDSEHLVVSSGCSVWVVPVQQAGYGRLTLGTATLVLTCTTPVVMLRACSMGIAQRCGRVSRGRRRGRALLVSEHGALHLSYDDGVSFLEVRHCLGYLRDVGTLDALRRSEQPAFPRALLESSLVPQTEAATPPAAATTGGGRPSSSYAYVSGYTCDANGTAAESRQTALDNFASVARRDGADDGSSTAYLTLFVAGTGAEVLPYDYTAMLTISTRRLSDKHPRYAVLSSAAHVTYIPFSRSRRQERLLCALARCIGRSAYVATRGSVVGVSTSQDVETWSTPRGAAPVGLVTTAGGEVVACGRHKILTVMGGSSSSGGGEGPRAIPSEFRVPYLLTAFSM